MNGTRTYPRRARDRVREHLLEEVASGRLRATEPLPSENELAVSFGVCRNTVRRAFFDLEKQGIIRRIRGKGTFLRSTAQAPRDQQQLQLLALILPQVRRSLYPSLIRGFGRAAAEYTQQVTVSQSDDSIQKQADIILQLLDKEVAGVAMVPTTVPATPAYHVRQLQKQNIPVVFCHRAVPGASAPCITWDWEQVGQMATRELLQRGHRRIGFLSLRRYGLPEAYVAGMERALDSAGIGQLDEDLIIMGFGADNAAGVLPEDARHAGHNGHTTPLTAAARTLLDRPDPPTAIFCQDENIAEELYLWAVDQKLRVPGDLSIIAAGDAARDGAISRRLACIAIDESRLGEHAAHILQEMIGGQRPINDTEQIFVPMSLSPGETLEECVQSA